MSTGSELGTGDVFFKADVGDNVVFGGFSLASIRVSISL
jgi:hypothetical protein